MKKIYRNILKCSLPVVAAVMATMGSYAEKRYAGGDISLLPEYEKAGAVYKDTDGKPVENVLTYFRTEGMNAMRVRLFVDPSAYKGSDADPNACQDLDYILPLCKRITEAGFDLMLDFHYSDTWADPGKQWTPAAWSGLSDEELASTLHDYTASTLRTLAEAGVTPSFIQAGNEISYGMLWGPYGSPAGSLKKTFLGSDANWERLGKLLNAAVSACREVCPQAEIVIHTERAADLPVLTNFYNRMKTLGVDYDIIGLSYYPYFHGKLQGLSDAISALERDFSEKQIMIVETGFPYKWEVPGTNCPVDYPYSEQGQNQFMTDLTTMLESHKNVTGLFWWWMEYNAFGTSLSGWYNAPLFDSTTGKACQALKTLAGFASDGNDAVESVTDLTHVEERWHTLQGVPAEKPEGHGIFISNHGRKVIVR